VKQNKEKTNQDNGGATASQRRGGDVVRLFFRKGINDG